VLVEGSPRASMEEISGGMQDLLNPSELQVSISRNDETEKFLTCPNRFCNLIIAYFMMVEVAQTKRCEFFFYRSHVL